MVAWLGRGTRGSSLGHSRSAPSPAGALVGAQHSMAAASFVQEMRSVGERLLVKLQRLPQADTVELLAFSIIVIFIGKRGCSGSGDPTVAAASSPSPRPRREGRRLLGEAMGFPWTLCCWRTGRAGNWSNGTPRPRSTEHSQAWAAEETQQGGRQGPGTATAWSTLLSVTVNQTTGERPGTPWRGGPLWERGGCPPSPTPTSEALCSLFSRHRPAAGGAGLQLLLRALLLP